MKKRTLWLAGLFVFLALILTARPALAHESITVGDYTLVVGWFNEPPIAGQPNAIVIEVTTSDEQPVEDVSSLTLTLSYGGQQKTLSLGPVDEHSPGQYMAPVLPTVAGEYTVLFGGTLGDTPVKAETHVEEVQPADTLAFPHPTSQETNSLGGTDWLAIAGFVTGLAGLILSLLNMRNNRR